MTERGGRIIREDQKSKKKKMGKDKKNREKSITGGKAGFPPHPVKRNSRETN